MAPVGAGAADSALALASAAGVSVGAAAGTIPIMGVTGAGDRPIMGEVSAAHTPTAVGAMADGEAMDIIPEPLLATIVAWRSAPLPATG